MTSVILNQSAPIVQGLMAKQEAAAITRDLERLISAISDGSASEGEIYKTAFTSISYASSMVGGCDFDGVEEMSKDEAMAALDKIESGAKHLRQIAPLFDKYPFIAAAMKDQIRALKFAESMLIPVFMMANRDYIARNDKSNSSTYIVKHPLTGLIKIGRARNVPERIKSLQTGAGAILSTLAVIPGDIERELHSKFSDLRRTGEWFEDADEVISRFAANQEKVA